MTSCLPTRSHTQTHARMNTPSRSLLRAPRLVLALSLPGAFALPAADPAAVLPDQSVAYLEMDSQAFYKLRDHPVTKTLPVADLKKLFYKLTDASPNYEEEVKKLIEKELGVSHEEMEKKAGRIAVSVHDLDIPANPTPQNVGVEISLAYEFDADEAFLEKFVKVIVKLIGDEVKRKGAARGEEIEKLLSKAAEFFEHSTAEHAGAKVHVFKLKETDETKEAPAFIREWAYSIHDKMILLASGREQVEEMIDRMKSGGSTGSLAASSYYKNDHDKSGKAIALTSLNLEIILGLVEKYALPAASGGDVDVKKIWTGLGADKLRSAVLGMSAGEETVDLAALLTYSEKPGLFGVFAIPGPGTAPPFLPKNLQSASYQQIDISKTLENLEKLAGEIDARASAGIQMGLSMAQQQTGVDLKKDLLGQLGPDVWVAAAGKGDTKLGDGSSPLGASEMALMGLAGGKSVIGVRVKDSKAFGLALETLINKVAQKEGLFDSQEYQGFTIYNVKESPEEFKVGYVLTEDWLMLSLGGKELLEQILSRLGKPGDDGYFAQKTVARHLEAMRGGQAMTAATDLGSALSDLIGMFGALMKQLPASGGPQLPFEELAKLLDVPLLSMDKGWLDERHFEYRARIAPKGE
jgi:hypothetical protein